MRSLIKYLLLAVFCLSTYVFTSCADAEYVAVYDPTPTVYYYSYPVTYRYYAPPRRVYSRPTPPPPPRKPAVVPKPYPKQNGNTHRPDRRSGNRGHGRR